MKKDLSHIAKYLLDIPQNKIPGVTGGAYLFGDLRIIASWGGPWDHTWGTIWDHVSVSLETRCPIWKEMCRVKDMFFDEDEVVIQYHPAKKDYVNHHPFCLHMWKPQGIGIPTPPKDLVGPS